MQRKACVVAYGVAKGWPQLVWDRYRSRDVCASLPPAHHPAAAGVCLDVTQPAAVVNLTTAAGALEVRDAAWLCERSPGAGGGC